MEDLGSIRLRIDPESKAKIDKYARLKGIPRVQVYRGLLEHYCYDEYDTVANVKTDESKQVNVPAAEPLRQKYRVVRALHGVRQVDLWAHITKALDAQFKIVEQVTEVTK